jgi:4-hydroxy-tetrahydrodipicolinate synthase
LRHWTTELGIDGVFFTGKQGEFFAMSIDERKRTFNIGMEVCGEKSGTMMSCSDQNLDTVLELAKHAENIGADYIIVHAPILHFVTDVNETVYQYYKYLSDNLNIAMAIWSHPDSGYLMSPELCNRIADLPNVVAIKYSVPREMYTQLTRLAGHKIIVSNPSEDHWLDNIVELGWQVYLCASQPYLLQTKFDRRMREYTDMAFAGETAKARIVRDSLEPVRHALKSTRPADKPQAQQKYWQDLLGQAGGVVRRPMLQLSDVEKAKIKSAFDTAGLQLTGSGTGKMQAAE